MPKIRVSLTTTDGELLDQFDIEDPKAQDLGLTQEEVAKNVRNLISDHYETEE